ncbi:MAG: UvrD-helicase domain-containing protein [Desulfomonilaceae bacterium]
MIFLADFHVHSRYSRATSRACNLVELARWAAIKGIRVVATGDFTHPAWRQEIHEMLEETDAGLFRLKREFQPQDDIGSAALRAEDVFFILNVEISSIYKAGGQVRKVHSLVFAPDFATMDLLSAKLERIGNIASDGRPILGLDARDLLEIALESSADCFVAPAHIWTPWFSVLGSKSGFCSIEECYRDLAGHIFVVETGLSSDPAMNYRLSSLDRFTLISNSDTHSPSRLGREANIIQGQLNYWSIRNALQKGSTTREPLTRELVAAQYMDQGGGAPDSAEEFLGTVEFFPEEGKYHLDGHRKCGVRLEPAQTEELAEKCPACGRTVTVGVMNRVAQLADRGPDFTPQRRPPFWRMLPLEEIIAQIVGTGPSSKKVQTSYAEIVAKLGPEIPLLCFYPLEELERRASPALVEAIRRARREEVSIKAGYDGQYGTVELFAPGEAARLFGQMGLFELPTIKKTDATPYTATRKRSHASPGAEKAAARWDGALNDDQRQAVEAAGYPILVQAGPGTGKTFTLTQRIVRLIREQEVPPSHIAAVTFTRKAAREMRTRVAHALGPGAAGCWIGTFHQLGLRILELFSREGLCRLPKRILGEEDSRSFFYEALHDCKVKLPSRYAKVIWEMAANAPRQDAFSVLDAFEIPAQKVMKSYRRLLRQHGAVEIDDLITLPVELLKRHPDVRSRILSSWKHILVDEFQDVNAAQYELVKLLMSPNGDGFFAIGDPDQAIYGFRGSDRSFFSRFPLEAPSCQLIHLTRNYRSPSKILGAARRVMGRQYSNKELVPAYEGSEPVKVVPLSNPQAEGRFITRKIESLLGGTSFESVDRSGQERNLSFRDFAVLYRLNAVGDTLEKTFAKSGIPYQRSKRTRPEEEADSLDPRAEAVSLMTIHASKGLEFPVVFIAGCEEGVIPYASDMKTPDLPERIDEECRLLYVAMTRAKHILYLTEVKKRYVHGRLLDGGRSRFLPRVIDFPFELERAAVNRGIKRRGATLQYTLFD